MKFLKVMKDGGPESTSTGYWLIEWKPVFSIVLLRFDGKSRDAFHTHAFHAVSWLLSGWLQETVKERGVRWYVPSLWPIVTKRDTFHKVDSLTRTSWAISFRGPWKDNWKEYLPQEDREITLTHGRKEQ